jgi:hypothetical protein
MCFIEDSGIFMPALYMGILLSGFIWLACDLHTWLTNVQASTGQLVTARDLMHQALLKETYAAHFAETNETNDTDCSLDINSSENLNEDTVNNKPLTNETMGNTASLNNVEKSRKLSR